jgi:membrane protein DedA with SNARE-associated domain
VDNNLQFVARHGYSVLFVWVLAEQAGLPIPSLPILLAMGAMAATGEMSFGVTLALAVFATLIADLGWYELGRRKGMRVLHFLCKVSLEPDSCVRQTESAFSKQGLRSLLVAKFIPGLSTAAPPLAGIFRLSIWRFLLYDAIGTVAWAGLFIGMGAAFSKQIESIEQRITQFGASLLTIALLALGLYMAWKFVKRELFIRELRVARLQPLELKQMMDAGEDVFIVDLRHPVDFEANPYSIVGALRISPEELGERHDQIPRDRDIILYCT